MPGYFVPIHYDVYEELDVEARNSIEAAAILKEKMTNMRKVSYTNPYYHATDNGEAVNNRTALTPAWDENIKIYDYDLEPYDNCGLKLPLVKHNSENDELDSDNKDKGYDFILSSNGDIDLFSTTENKYTEWKAMRIIFIHETRTFMIKLREDYQFETGEEKLKHLDKLQEHFRKYLIQLGINEDTLSDLKECSSFKERKPTAIMNDIMTLQAKTLVDLYYKFALFVKAYSTIANIEKEIQPEDREFEGYYEDQMKE